MEKKPTDYLIIKKPDPLFNEIKETVDDASAQTSAWQQNQEKFNRIRMRQKKEKTFPFKDSSNLRMPTADIAIKKIKAGIMAAVFGAKPVVQATPTPSGSYEGANIVAKFIDHLVTEVIKLPQKAEVCVDQSCEKGFYIGKVFWRLEICDREEIIKLDEIDPQELQAVITESDEVIIPVIVERMNIDMNENVADHNINEIVKALNQIRLAKKEVTLNLKDVIYNFPDVDFISPERFYVPSGSGVDIQKLQEFTIEFFISIDNLKYNAKYKGWDEKVIKKINSSKNEDYKNIDLQKDEREGIERLQDSNHLIKVWETYGWFDIDGSGKKRKCVVTSLPDFSVIVRKVKLSSLSKKWPVVKFPYEITDDRWFSHRGVVEMLEDIVKEIDVQHNMKIDYQTLNNAPMIVYRAGMVNPRTARLNPAGGIPVNGMNPLDDTIKAIQLHNPNVEYSYEREQMILETKIQEITGQIDYGLQSMINRRQPRTLGEVELQNSNAGSVFSLDVKHYTNAFSELFELIFELWCEFGPDDYEFNYFGQLPQGEKIKLNREEIQNKYRLTVKGNDLNTNPQFRIQQAQQIMMALQSPLLLQTGVIGPQQIAEGLKRMYQSLQIDDWEMLVNLQPQPLQPPPQTAIQPDFAELTHGEKAQVLQAFGVVPDVPGRVTKRTSENMKDAAEIASMIGGEEQIGGTNAEER